MCPKVIEMSIFGQKFDFGQFLHDCVHSSLSISVSVCATGMILLSKWSWRPMETKWMCYEEQNCSLTLTHKCTYQSPLSNFMKVTHQSLALIRCSKLERRLWQSFWCLDHNNRTKIDKDIKQNVKKTWRKREIFYS